MEGVDRFDVGLGQVFVGLAQVFPVPNPSLSPADTPGPPGPLKIKELTKDSATITWEAPVVDGGAPVNNYVIERREASMRAYKTVTSKCSKTSYRIDNLLEGMLYYFRVLPENIYGIGEPCETPDVVLVCDVPLPPSKFEVSAGSEVGLELI